MSANRPKFQHPRRGLRGGAFFTLVVPSGKRRRRRANDSFLERSPQRLLDRRRHSRARGFARWTTSEESKRIDRAGVMLASSFFFFVSMRTHLRETMTKKRRARARTRGGASSSRKRALKRHYSPPPPSCARAHWWNRVRKTALLVPSPSIDGVAE